MPIKKVQIETAPDVLETTAKPTTGANKGSYFVKEVNGVIEGFYVDDQGREIQLTNNGNPAGGGGGGGEANTASNVGTGEGSLFQSKSGVDLKFRKIKAGSNIIISTGVNDVTISSIGGGSGDEMLNSTFLNSTGVTINALIPVKQLVDGSIALVNPSLENDIENLLGITVFSIDNGASGYVIFSGLISDVTTSFIVGDVIYLSKTGTLTTTVPEIGTGGFVAGDFVVKIGKIVRNKDDIAKKDFLVLVDPIGQL